MPLAGTPSRISLASCWSSSGVRRRDDRRPHLAAVAVAAVAAGASAFKHLASGIVHLGVEIRCDPDERQPGEHTDWNAHELTASVLIRGASPLRLPNTLSRAAAPARSDRVAHSLPLVRAINEMASSLVSSGGLRPPDPLTRSLALRRRPSDSTWERSHKQTSRTSDASEPRERSAPTKRRARERVGGSGGRSPPDETSPLYRCCPCRLPRETCRYQ